MMIVMIMIAARCIIDQLPDDDRFYVHLIH